MGKFHVKKGDEVVVIAGSSKGRRGKVDRVLTSREAVILEGTDEKASKETEDRRRLIKPVLHHLRRSQQNPNGGLLWLEGPIHVSNVMKAEVYEARRASKTQG